MRKLRVGEIPYMNLFPIFHELRDGCDHSDYEFIEGHPSEVNKMLREGLLDISPSSSVEYLKDRDNYIIFDGHSISSEGPVESILLFSRQPIEDIDGHEIFVTHRSETSPVLLRIILEKFYGISVALRTTRAPIKEAIEAHSAYLAIGDEALVTAGRARKIDMHVLGDFELYIIGHDAFYTYDLGNLWHRKTGLPFVFALWTARKQSMNEKKELFERFKNDLDKAKTTALENLEKIAASSGMRDIIGAERLVSYWNGISYDLAGKHMKGLELFGKYAKELKLL
ncbi:MAG: menaquinone biosynthesis protein [Thermodesulfovibrionales bacterium]|nr:menaquinone biosynthesis protein [Thermodesulfovibrionales bacterium]